MPWLRERMRHLGGKMLETRTRLQAAMPAERRASSNEVSFSRCFPTPLVKNISLGTNPTTSGSLSRGKLHGKWHLIHCQGMRQSAARPGTSANGWRGNPAATDNLALLTIRYTNNTEQ